MQGLNSQQQNAAGIRKDAQLGLWGKQVLTPHQKEELAVPLGHKALQGCVLLRVCCFPL